jgi:hypothetical protein
VKKKFFDKTKNHDVVYFTHMKNRRSGNEPKTIHYVQTRPPDVKNLKKSSQQFL